MSTFQQTQVMERVELIRGAGMTCSLALQRQNLEARPQTSTPQVYSLGGVTKQLTLYSNSYNSANSLQDACYAFPARSNHPPTRTITNSSSPMDGCVDLLQLLVLLLSTCASFWVVFRFWLGMRRSPGWTLGMSLHHLPSVFPGASAGLRSQTDCSLQCGEPGMLLFLSSRL